VKQMKECSKYYIDALRAYARAHKELIRFLLHCFTSFIGPGKPWVAVK
jgi:hypothetical protein